MVTSKATTGVSIAERFTHSQNLVGSTNGMDPICLKSGRTQDPGGNRRLWWNTAWISLIPKVPVQKSHTNYRPIFITSILSRRMVHHFLYPAFSIQSSVFSDQYAFRSSRSTTAAISILPSYCLPAFSWQWLCHNIGTWLLQSIWYCSSPFIHSFIFVYYQLSKRNQTRTTRCN